MRKEQCHKTQDRRHPGPWMPPGKSALLSLHHLVGEGRGDGGGGERQRGSKYQCLIHTHMHTILLCKLIFKKIHGIIIFHENFSKYSKVGAGAGHLYYYELYEPSIMVLMFEPN